MGDVVIPGLFSDDWDVDIVNSMLFELNHYTVFEDEDLYLNSANLVEQLYYHHYGYHYLHRANVKRTFFNYMEWEHCPTPPQGSSKQYKDKFTYFSGHNLTDPKSFYFKLAPTPAKKYMPTQSKLIYTDLFINTLALQGYDCWRDSIDAKVYCSKRN